MDISALCKEANVHTGRIASELYKTINCLKSMDHLSADYHKNFAIKLCKGAPLSVARIQEAYKSATVPQADAITIDEDLPKWLR